MLKIYQLLLSLISICKYNLEQIQVDGVYRGFSTLTVLKDFKTIGLTLPRQVGKTMALSRLFKESVSIMFVKNEHDGFLPDQENVYVFQDRDKITPLSNIEYIIVDDSSDIFNSEFSKEDFYNWVAQEYGTTPIIIIMN